MRILRLTTFFALVAFLVACPNRSKQEFTSADVSSRGLAGPDFAEDGAAAPVGDGGEAENPARTVTEPDLIFRDGDTLYVLNQYRGLTIVDLDAFEIRGRVPTYGLPKDLYIVGERAYVLVGHAQQFVEADGVISAGINSQLYVVDFAAQELVDTFDLEGDLVDSRLVGDILYTVRSNAYYFGFDDVVEPGGGDVPVDTGFQKGQGSTTWITAVDVSDPENVGGVDELEFDGQGTVIHVTTERAFAAAPNYAAGDTVITHIDISDAEGAMEVLGATVVRGFVQDRFKLDAWEGTLRVVSSEQNVDRQTYLTTIDLATLEPLAELRLESAEGDTLFATRFDGDRGYVVTYFLVDPLYVLDLADPANPAILGELEVPGFSTHIQPLDGRLIALGVDDTSGRRVSVSIFDVASGTPSLLDRATFGEDWSWSSAHDDVKAFTILDDLLIVPFSGWNESFGGYDRLQFVSYTADALDARGFVDVQGTIRRSFEYDGLYYGVTDEQLVAIDGSDLDTPQVVDSLALAENVTDFLPLDNGRGIEIITRYDDATTVVRLVDENQSALDELALSIGGYTDHYRIGDRIAVVGISWNDVPGYNVAILELSDDTLELVGTPGIQIEPYYGYYFYGPYPVEPFIDRAKLSILPPYPVDYGTGDRGFVIGGQLLLRGFADSFDRVIGEESSRNALAVVDVENAVFTEIIGLGFERVVSLDAVDDLLYLGTKDGEAFDAFRPVVSYFLRTADPVSGDVGPLANVPGTFLQYDAASDLLLLRDFQWSGDFNLSSSVESVRWDGGETVEALDSLELPLYAGTLVASGNHVYFDAYDSGYRVGHASIGGSGAFSELDYADLGQTYGSVLGAVDENVFLSLNGSNIAHYAFTPGASLVQVEQVSGYPAVVRFGEDAAYFPLGYFGLAKLDY